MLVMVGITVRLVYDVAFEGEVAQLRDFAKSQALLVEATARLSSHRSDGEEDPDGVQEAILRQLSHAEQDYGSLVASGTPPIS